MPKKGQPQGRLAECFVESIAALDAAFSGLKEASPASLEKMPGRFARNRFEGVREFGALQPGTSPDS